MIDTQIFDPFPTRADSFKAVQVVHRTYSDKLKNFKHVTNIINKVLGSNFDETVILNFIGQVIAYPLLYGYSAVEQYTQLLDEIRSHSLPTKSPTVVLTPNITECFFCPQKQYLEIKKTGFCKNPLLFGVICIGKF